jgi:mRNA-degrading endonuclease RelE of RelBE toxin-antitoxin system
MVEIIISESYKKYYKKLPKEIQKIVDKKLELFMENPNHPSLKIHNIKTTDFYEFYINKKYRNIFKIKNIDSFELIAIGIHDIIDEFAKKKK